MASLKDIKRRIGSVKSTQKITNAMKLVSASKFAKASNAVNASRPYGATFDQMVERIVAGAGDDVQSQLVKADIDGNRVLLVIVGTDRGLCGPLNANVFKETDRFLANHPKAKFKVSLSAWGRRPLGYARKTGLDILSGDEKVLADTSYAHAKELAQGFITKFLDGEFDSVHIVYPSFRSAILQEPTCTQLLPYVADAENSGGDANYIVEPGLAEMLDPLVQRWVVSKVHRVLLESAASEHGARMSAMDNATNNAKEVTRKLTLAYNRARQAAITTELTEIISGAEAL